MRSQNGVKVGRISIVAATRLTSISLLALLAGAVFLWSDAPFDVDDAPITYRYAANLSAGLGFVYNAGEAVQGTSTPLFTLVLAGAHKLGIDIADASNGIGLASAVAIVVLTCILTESVSGSLVTGLLAGALVLSESSFVRFAMSGMETPLYTLFIVGNFLALAKHRARLAVILAVLATLTRLDGFAILATVLLKELVETRRLPLRSLAVAVFLLVPWFAFAWLYFGSVLPHSMLAKQQHLVYAAGDRWWIWSWLFLLPLQRQLYLVICAVAGLLAILADRPRRNGWQAPLGWLLAYLIAYTAIGIPFYEWYLTPVYPVLAMLSAYGARAAISVAVAGHRRWTVPARFVVGVALLSFLLPAQYQFAYISVSGWREYLSTVEATRAMVGTWLAENTPANSKVSVDAIGHIGYVSGRYVIDRAGLVTSAADQNRLQPDYFITSDAAPASKCTVLKQFETGWPNPPRRIEISQCTDH